MKQIENDNGWIDVNDREPSEEGYYEVKFDNGVVDEKPFRIRPSNNIRGFMTENIVTHWRQCKPDTNATETD